MYQTNYDEVYAEIFKIFDRGFAVGTGSNVNTLIRVLADFQLWLDNGFESIHSSWIIDEAVGEQLDEIGDDIHQPRYGTSDETYRFILKTKLLAAHSGGTINDIINIVCNALQIDPKTSGLKVHTDYHWDGTKMVGNPQVVDIDQLPTSLISSHQTLLVLMDRLSSATLNGVEINTVAFMNTMNMNEYVGIGVQSITVENIQVEGGK
ncbi:hypothetical protein [Lentilactobacillus hilgardii]|uniref:DUF2612 domain-containing protein n=1 Tax=Lentilactobacillus hilgardii (strain ATCC 8290 / DSM 20176 / CCUG 30140 / JCM 1155 / KCTC 3500 / NBRC 15886 / NCIMB 8040 / NRRL B-1843 / 9) TaxID=1423757 RepID=C0XG29_LENH9|nr:hypothetical protein [Lentilactobacillus hilgardii]EEI25666.1 hypothetical protein HMPREF0519_0190 [Lentilactobacillus hilgardii DSM 20176 = ATCC 8290]KRK53527.1 hypothetical protein FD42_GL002083 [Lentilactobacillus hilgardii DSM 20176 = ATCC 8290]QEU38908.1 DUF2612 domain-containing protein [Lentilactobacillus hilgardii]TDG86525.1 hypothetical protein C5L34_002356 [Lentilactobacillus hilgardii]